PLPPGGRKRPPTQGRRTFITLSLPRPAGTGCIHTAQTKHKKRRRTMKNMISRRNFLKAAGAVSAAGVLAACGSSSSSTTAASTATSSAAGASSSAAAPAAAGKVYYLNFKPEQDEAWQNLAAEYTAETGVPVTVVTAAANQYETTLMS